MAAENWANFGSISEPKDDDWEDFGGFESATPVSNAGHEESTASSLISWAAFPSPVPSAVSPGVNPTNQQLSQVMSSPVAIQQKAPFPATDFPLSVDTFTTQLPANQQLPGATAIPLTANQQACAHPSASGYTEATNQQATSSIPERPGSTWSTPDSTETGKNQSERIVPRPAITDVQPVKELNQKQGDTLDISRKYTEDMLKQAKELQEARDSKISMKNKIEALENGLATAEKEKSRIQQEQRELLEKNKKTEAETEKLTESLERQKDKYKKLQDQHQEQIEDIRKSGHDALAIIVEEYKELSKKAVVEQLEQSGIHMQTVLADERKKFQQILLEQQEKFEAILREERDKNAGQTQEALEEQKGKHKEQIQSCLQEERQKSQEYLLRAVEEAREQGVQATERTIQQEKETFEKTIEEQKESMLRMLEEERQKSREMAEEVIKKERENNKVELLEALAEERQRSKEALKQGVEETKTEMLVYLKEKQKADGACRHRHFLALDLFLESARTQLQSLMNDKEDDAL